MRYWVYQKMSIQNKLKNLIENLLKNIIQIIIKKEKIGQGKNLLKSLRLMKLYQILKKREFMIWVEKMLLMKLNKDKIKDKVKVEVLEVVASEVVDLEVVDFLLKIYLKVHLVVNKDINKKEKEDEVEDEEVGNKNIISVDLVLVNKNNLRRKRK